MSSLAIRLSYFSDGLLNLRPIDQVAKIKLKVMIQYIARESFCYVHKGRHRSAGI